MKYVPERSFSAIITFVDHENEHGSARFDFSKIVSAREPSGRPGTIGTYESGTEEFEYLTLTTQPREEQRFWFLYWEDANGAGSYEIRTHHWMFREGAHYRSLGISKGYVFPQAAGSVRGWQLCWTDKANALDGRELKVGDNREVFILSPSGKILRAYSRTAVGRSWWEYVVDNGGEWNIPLTLQVIDMNIQEPR